MASLICFFIPIADFNKKPKLTFDKKFWKLWRKLKSKH